MPNRLWDAVIIGGGHNGLVAAAYLARAGVKTLVLEGRDILGGACVTEEVFPGFRVSTAAYLCSLLDQQIVRDLDLTRHGYRVYLKDPTFFTPFPDGRHFFMWQDQQKTCREISRFSPRDAAAYPEYEARMDRIARFTEKLFLKTPPRFESPGWRDYLQLGRLGWSVIRLPRAERVEMTRILTQSAADFLDRWFESEALKVTLATDGVIGANGGPRSPGTAYVLLHHVMGNIDGHRGVWGFVRGGMGTVSEAIASAARQAGAEIRTGAFVERILIRDGQVSGVALISGEELSARAVLSNVDPKRTFLGLINSSDLDPEFVKQVKGIRMKGVSMKINLALGGLPNFKALPGSSLMPCHRATIHICPSVDYIEVAWDDAKYGRPSRNPFLELTIPTAYDDSLAPSGKHLMGIFIQYAPYDLKDASWHELKETYANRVIDVIEEYAPGFRGLILDRHVLSPLDLEETFGLTGGNIFHGEMSLDQLFFLRPLPGWAQYRSPVRHLYLCGSGTHPGGGVTGIPGYNAAREFLNDWKAGKI